MINAADKLSKEDKTNLVSNVLELMVFSFAAGFISACAIIVALKP